MRFLAVLELYKQGLVDLDQAAAFGDIEIRWLGRDGARAGRRRRPGRRRRLRGLMSDEARRAVEAILMVADRPVDPHLLAQVTEMAPAAMEALLAELAAAYEAEDRGFVLVKVAGGYRFQSHPDLTGYVERFVLEGQNARLSSAALETMAIIAYKQPDLAGPDRLDPRRQRRRRGAHPRAAGLHRRGRPRPRARPGRAVRHHRPVPRAAGPGSLDDLPPIAEFVPGADVVEALEHGLRVEPRPGARSPSAVVGGAATPGRSAATVATERRRRAAAEGAGPRRDRQPAGVRGPDRRRAGSRSTARWPSWGGGSIPTRTWSRSTGPPSACAPGLVHYLLNKPAGVVTTADDPQGRPTVVDLVPDEPRVFPVGRLDLDTEGLLVLTNDGELTHRLTHPSFGVDKEYLAHVEGRPDPGRAAPAARGGRARRRAHRAGPGGPGGRPGCCGS